MECGPTGAYRASLHRAADIRCCDEGLPAVSLAQGAFLTARRIRREPRPVGEVQIGVGPAAAQHIGRAPGFGACLGGSGSHLFDDDRPASASPPEVHSRDSPGLKALPVLDGDGFAVEIRQEGLHQGGAAVRSRSRHQRKYSAHPR